jgi:hypothetical protein
MHIYLSFPAFWYAVRWDLNLLDSQPIISEYFPSRFVVIMAFCIIPTTACNFLSTFPRIFHQEENDDDNRREYKYAY